MRNDDVAVVTICTSVGSANFRVQIATIGRENFFSFPDTHTKGVALPSPAVGGAIGGSHRERGGRGHGG